jgi:hypothetical protein
MGLYILLKLSQGILHSVQFLLLLFKLVPLLLKLSVFLRELVLESSSLRGFGGMLFFSLALAFRSQLLPTRGLLFLILLLFSPFLSLSLLRDIVSFTSFLGL